MSFLQKVSTPAHHSRSSAAGNGEWFTWSSGARALIATHRERLESLRTPDYISVQGCEPYSSSYTYQMTRLPRPLQDLAVEMAEDLLDLRVGNSLRFLCAMLDEPFTSRILHKTFAIIRTGIVQIQADRRAALHSPVKIKHRDEDGFPLHSDLFLTDRLWLIFDEVSPGSSGRTMLLSRRDLDSSIASSASMPPNVRRTLRMMRDGHSIRDGFDRSFELLHDEDFPWRSALAAMMKKQCWSIKLRRGEGYLLNDRRWLHGRTPVVGRVTKFRFHRLVFGEIPGTH